jgi:hypothetical protein
VTLFEEDYSPITVTWDKEMWIVDPGPFIDIAFEMGMQNFVFRAQYHESGSMKQDFRKWIDIYSRGRPWKVIWMPYPGDFCCLFTSIMGWDHPAAVWQVWRANENKLIDMERMFNEPPEPGTVLGTFGVHSRSHSEPVEVVKGQPHRLVLANNPMSDNLWEPIASFAQRLQASNPEATIHYHGGKSVGRTIGIAAKSFDHPVRIGWDDGIPIVLLPNGMRWPMGKKINSYQAHWLKIIGVNPRTMLKLNKSDLSREVYRVNLLSLRWAFLNWDRAWDFRRATADEIHIAASDMDWEPTTLKIRMRRTRSEDQLLDRWLCNTCSLQFRCPYSREGAVCIVPDSEPVELAQFFQTRNSGTIVEGLGVVLGAMARRANTGIAAESKRTLEDGETGLSPEVTRILNSLFDRGVQLAKLVDPKLAARMGPKINVGVINTAGGPGMTSQALLVGVAAELESRGIKLEDATAEDIERVLSENALAIEASSTEVDS